jgi:hypothetical protein
LDEDQTKLISGVDLFAPLSLERIERIAQGIPSTEPPITQRTSWEVEW